MERRFNLLIVFFIFVALLSLAGFFNSYISLLPDKAKFPLVIHIHFAAFVCWFILLIVQPILIRRKKYDLHRQVGKISYILAPILVTTILILVKQQAESGIMNSRSDVFITSFIGVLDAISFSTFYLIAMLNRQNVRWHVAFLIGATLVVLNPGMSRLFNQIIPGLGLLVAILLPFVIPIAILSVEKFKHRRPILKSPYFLFLCCWTTEIILFLIIPNTDCWRNFILKVL